MGFCRTYVDYPIEFSSGSLDWEHGYATGLGALQGIWVS